MGIKIALAGNPNSGKTTLFNVLTGSNQYVGNWPGVTVEKKEGRLKSDKNVTIQDLPGIYSLSPYTPEEIVSRNYLVGERPDAILNIIDGTNIERNLYLTTQLIELGIPVVVAVNMMDLVNKNGDKIDTEKLGNMLHCKVVTLSALKGEGSEEAAKAAAAAATAAAKSDKEHPHVFTGSVEHAIAHIEESIENKVDKGFLRWYAIKLFERDTKVVEELKLSADLMSHIEQHIKDCETELDDDAESIITNQRYTYIDSVVSKAVKRGTAKHALSTSDKIDRVVTHRVLALPIFIAVMWLIYAIAMGGLPVSIGTNMTDWTNDHLFADGWFWSGGEGYEDDAAAFEEASVKVESFLSAAEEQGIATDGISEALENRNLSSPAVNEFITNAANLKSEAYFYDDETGETATEEVDAASFQEAIKVEEPDPNNYGVYARSIPMVVSDFLEGVGCAPWLQGLIVDGIVAGVGAVLGFVPQMLVLFLLLSILEDVGYMARIAFIMDRIFRKFGLSGKSFIPMLVGTGCGVPGVMASRTIENERDRRMTIMTTCFIPCGAKMPIIALFAGALFGGSSLVATSAYFIGVAAIVISGIILKKTQAFAGEPAPFVMELPKYHMPSVVNVLRATWERGWSFIKRAGTVILASSIILWFLQGFGMIDGSLQMTDDANLSLLAAFGNTFAFIFTPLGFGNWKAAVATITGLIAKENVVSTFAVLYPGNLSREIALAYTPVMAYSFMIFNLLCAPCFAAMGAIKREMNNAKWTWAAIGYMCVFAYVIALIVYQVGNMIFAGTFGIGTIIAFLAIAGIIYLLFRKNAFDESGKRIVSKAAA